MPIDPICLAALRCFAVSGFHGTSIRQIAAEAGLSVPGLYHHYPSKGAILVALCEAAMRELLTASRAAIAAGSTTLERFERLVVRVGAPHHGRGRQGPRLRRRPRHGGRQPGRGRRRGAPPGDGHDAGELFDERAVEGRHVGQALQRDGSREAGRPGDASASERHEARRQ